MKGKTYFEKHLFQPIKIKENPDSNVGIIIVIPCFNEPEILPTIHSIFRCEAPAGNTEIIVVINAPEDASDEVLCRNQNCFEDLKSFIEKNEKQHFRIFVLKEENLPVKTAGVGLARKIGMDEAAFRFEKAGRKEGVIICLDADCTVASNYLKAIESHYQRNPETKAASVYFEHPLNNSAQVNEGIINYELHLRYYIQAQRFCNYPFAYHTIGSSMTVRSDIYRQQGGMNKRKAGEDFYFLHKIMPLGGFYEINETKVHPSPRISDRVPFGTGKAMGDWAVNPLKIFTTYNPKTFDVLKDFLETVNDLFRKNKPEDIQSFLTSIPKEMSLFLCEYEFEEKILEINQNSTGLVTFRNRFFRWFNGLMVLKFAHYSRYHFFENIPVEDAAYQLLDNLKADCYDCNKQDLLNTYRTLDKSGWKKAPTF